MDITFIGSGIATTATLIELFGKLLKKEHHTGKLNITVIEKTAELWLGIPYGSRSSVNGLSITCALEFIHEPERPAFFEWLKASKNDWAPWYIEHGGITAARWLESNTHLIDKEDWETIYIPRFLFGRYMREKLVKLLKTVQEKQLVTLDVVQAEAIDIKMIDGGLHEIVLEQPDNTITTIVSRKVIIATGSGPVKKMLAEINDNFVYINDIYEPAVDENLNRLRIELSKIHNAKDRNVLMIGSNAAAIEFLYLLESRLEIRQMLNKLIIISPSGLLPYRISTQVLDSHPTPNLDKLKDQGDYTLETLIGATALDLKYAVKNGANVAYIATVITNTLQLLNVLGEEARKVFIGKYGMKLSGMFRRAGHEYKNASQLLIDLQQVTLLKGKFSNVIPTDDGTLLSYIDVVTGAHHTPPLSFKVIVNCAGSENLDQSSSRLISNLVSNKTGKINLSCKGFEVNEHFEIAPNLYVMGPLLGGNMNKLIHFWHLENAPRILYLAPYLADELINKSTRS